MTELKENRAEVNGSPSVAQPATLVLIDPRDIFRESLLSTLQPLLNQNVYSVQTVSRLLDSKEKYNIGESSNTLILICTGSLDPKDIRGELELVRRYLKNAHVALMADRVDAFHSDFFNEGIADGIVLSTFGIEQLRVCLATIGAGIAFIPRDFYEQSPNSFQKLENQPLSSAKQNDEILEGITYPPAELVDLLTQRQLQVMEYVVLGKSNKYIAAELDLRESTVKVHVHDSMKRLSATSRTHASYLIAKMSLNEPEL